MVIKNNLNSYFIKGKINHVKKNNYAKNNIKK